MALSDATVTEPAALTAGAGTVTNVSCFGGSDGSVTVTPGGGTSPYTYAWSSSPVQTTQTATGLSSGTYWVTVTDNNSCTSSSSATVAQPAAGLSASAGVVNHLSCYGGSNGSATVSVTGGTTPYTFAWSTSPVQTTETATGLQAGIFYITVTDSHGCTANSSATLTQPAQWWPGVTGDNNPCQGSTQLYTTEAGMTDYTWTISPVISGATTITAGQTVVYSTPYLAGHLYSWNVSNGNSAICMPDHNCITVSWLFPCGIINPGYVTVSEFDPSSGCSSMATVWITINP